MPLSSNIPSAQNPASEMDGQGRRRSSNDDTPNFCNAFRTGHEKYHRLVGQEVEILVEGPSRRNPARLEGHRVQ